MEKVPVPSSAGLVARQENRGRLQVTQQLPQATRYAFIGVRSCELHAITIQDRALIAGPYTDPHYKAARDGIFVVAINCGQAGGTCFCVSMGTGPRSTFGYDLALTEVIEDGRHYRAQYEMRGWTVRPLPAGPLLHLQGLPSILLQPD
jgi:hypothetical protein